MERKRDILWRVYVCFLGIVIISFFVLGKAFYIQRVQGNYWRGLSDSLHQKFIELNADRGTIYSEDGNMLSTSIPYFNIYIDFGADGLREKNGKRFKENLDSLSYCLASLFRDRSAVAYKRELQQGFKNEDRFYELQRNLSFEQYKILRSFPLVRLGRNKSGFITEVISKRLNPFGLLANRTIGLARANAQNVGLERTYDSLLKGANGSRLVRYMAAGTYIPVEGYEIDPENGKDIMTTIDVNIQDIAENALLKMMGENECDHGTCIVMEVGTGKIKAMANLGRQSDGSYWEDLNYAIRASEPGSTFKLATLLSLLEDKNVKLTDHLDLEGGAWKYGKRTVRDVEKHEKAEFTVKQAFELSSNVGMAKLAVGNYAKDPNEFIEHLKKLHLNQVTGVDLAGETPPIVKTPKSRTWSATTLPWMAFGYEVLISPLQTLALYNAVANNGVMVKPYLVNSFQSAGRIEKKKDPMVVVDKICSEQTLTQLKECLEGVCIEGTAKTLFKNSFYKVAGKTGTALVANGNRGYADHIYQSSFAGYFPAKSPKYSCIVVIKNKPHAKKFLGALVAGPVFREVADKLMSLEINQDKSLQMEVNEYVWKKDSAQYYYAGSKKEMKSVLSELNVSCADSTGRSDWGRIYPNNYQPVITGKTFDRKLMPDVKGMGLRDALALLEERNIRVAARGVGKVKQQSIEPGTPISKNQILTLELNE
ncbi:MAG: peptidoglycan glycosyltransferase [Bacteroidetes bacterium]|nr:MAG: peptidoglycan glycosyltransferase [Bacteroidota bacterium]